MAGTPTSVSQEIFPNTISSSRTSTQQYTYFVRFINQSKQSNFTQENGGMIWGIFSPIG